MQDVIVALYDQYSSAVNVRTELVKDGFATDRIEVTSQQEHRQAEKGPNAAFEANVADYFRTLGEDDESLRQMQEFTRAVVKGASAVTVHPRGEEELKRVDAILERHAPTRVYRHVPDDSGHQVDRQIERAAGGPDAEREARR